MKLGKLNGYDATLDTYTDPLTGQIALLPNAAFELVDVISLNYTELTGTVDFYNYAKRFIGSVTNFRDYLAYRKEIYTRIEIITGANYLLWNNLTNEEKSVALEICNIRIINALGITFFVTECGGTDTANYYVNLHLVKGESARIVRYNAFANYGYTYLGKAQGIKAEDYARKDFLDDKYIVRGVVYKSEDGVDGLGDWILGTNGYVITGLKPRIVSGEFVLPLGVDVNIFCALLVSIIEIGTF